MEELILKVDSTGSSNVRIVYSQCTVTLMRLLRVGGTPLEATHR